MFTKLFSTIGGIAICAAANGCVVTEHSSDPVPGPEGTLTTTWALDGSDDPDACAYYRIDTVRVIIVDDYDNMLVDDEPVCEAFGVTFDLPVGWYTTQVTLQDGAGHGVSETVMSDVQVSRDTDVFVDVNFPDATIF